MLMFMLCLLHYTEEQVLDSVEYLGDNLSNRIHRRTRDKDIQKVSFANTTNRLHTQNNNLSFYRNNATPRFCFCVALPL